MSGEAVDHSALDAQIASTRAELGRVAGDTSGSTRGSDLQAHLQTLYQERFGRGPVGSPTPPDDPKPAPGTIQERRERIRASDAYQRGEPSAQKALEATYKEEHPPGPDASDAPATPTTRLEWGGAPASKADAGVRASVEAMFGRFGLTSGEGNRLMRLTRDASEANPTEEQYDALYRSGEATLRAKWGKDFDARLRAVYHLADVFLGEIGHRPEVERALDNGLLLRVDFIEALDAIAEMRGVRDAQEDIQKLRKLATRAVSGGARWNEINKALEQAYKHLHGRE